MDEIEKRQAFPFVNGGYQAQFISLRKNGLVIQGNGRGFSVEDGRFGMLNQDFVPDNFDLKGDDAFVFIKYLEDMVVSFESKHWLIAISRNPALLNAIKDEKPYLLNQPSIQKALADAFLSNQIPRPKLRTRKPDVTKDIFDLYHYVYFYRHQGMTLENACMETLENHSELVPLDWLKNINEPIDAMETLKKKIVRLDNCPAISAKNTLRDRLPR
ncbi:MAG: hypothetical protein Q8N96_10965 [Methylovulum sp.]|nr:hypothetical protein [Methylovulum sp.]